MNERPILFSGPMVRAILAGRKTMTRRVVKPQPPDWCRDAGISALTPPCHWEFRGNYQEHGPASKFIRCQFLPVSETRLWVRESFSAWFQGIHWYAYKGIRDDVAADNVFYRATHNYPDDDQKWVPSIHMPRWASRITLDVTAVRVERLQQITQEDAIAEGLIKLPATGRAVLTEGAQYFGNCWSSPRAGFRELWNGINGKCGFPWDVNPWVWVVKFKRGE